MQFPEDLDLISIDNNLMPVNWHLPIYKKPAGRSITPGELDEDQLQMTEHSKEFFHSPYNFSSYLLTLFLKKHLDEKISILKNVSEAVWVQDVNFAKCVKMLEEKYGFSCIPCNEILFFKREDVIVLLTLPKNTEIDNVQIYSRSKELAYEILTDIKTFDAQIKKLSFYWIVNNKGDAVNIVEEWEETVSADLYPFINDFDTYAERFIRSKSNILILLGPPGTGKTTMLKHIIEATQKKAYITYDESVLDGDGSFAEFMQDDSAGSFIIEDADLFLRSRADGNGMVSRFLNIGDGLIKLKNKALVFTTNLKNTAEMDPALIRPGRCFDILHFRSLTKVEAQVVADNRGLQLNGNQDNYTLAEIFNSPVINKKTTFGFI